MPEKRVGANMHNKILQEKILENLVELQKVHTSIAERFDKLSNQISSLLRLFEAAARSFASSPANQYPEKDKDFLDKIDKLLDQNKVIARGLTLIEEKVRERMQGFAQQPTEQQEQPVQQEESLTPSLSSVNRPLPRF